jgi:hypothetical protein
MTREEFIAITQLHPERVNVWYEPSTSIIYGISIPVLDNSDQNIINYLTQVQQIGVPLPLGGTVVLNITSRQLVNSSVNNIQVSCYYFDVIPTSVVNLTQSTVTGSVQLLPAIDGGQFYDSPYNVLHGSIEDFRSSTYIMQSDRYKVGTLANPTYTGPLNIDQLLSGSALLAHVQDSNYTLTGWTNGRYNGTKTTRLTYKTDPAIGGVIFKGAELPATVTDSQLMYLTTNNLITYKDMFSAGAGDTPGFYSVPSGYIYTGSANLDPLSTTMTITQRYGETNLLRIPKPGDFYKLQSEIVRVESVAVITLPWLRYTLGVTRGYNSPTGSHNNTAAVEYVSQVQIYNITRNKLTGVPKGSVLVKETGVLAKLDSLGYIVTSSQTPQW